MADYVEKWGDDIDSAVELALKDLKLTRDQVNVTVLEQPSMGFLGLFKKKLAKVRVEKKPVEPVKKSVESVKAAVPQKPAEPEEKNVSKDLAPVAAEKKPAPVQETHEARPEKI